MADARRHWLVDLAIQAGLPGSDSTVVDPGASLPDAWTAVGRAAGVSDADLASRVAARHRLAVANLETAEPAALTLVPEKTARRYLVYPLRATDRQLVVAIANLTLHDAVSEGASDIHLEPGRDGGTVRFRVDGVLRPFMQLPLTALNRVVSRIKIMGKLDIADRLRPQDGRARVQVASRTFDL